MLGLPEPKRSCSVILCSKAPGLPSVETLSVSVNFLVHFFHSPSTHSYSVVVISGTSRNYISTFYTTSPSPWTTATMAPPPLRPMQLLTSDLALPKVRPSLLLPEQTLLQPPMAQCRCQPQVPLQLCSNLSRDTSTLDV